MTLAPGTRLGPYEILSLIGAGGMGEVYEARDARLGRRVALKVLPGTEAGDERSRERLIQEARAAAQLDHPHICTVYEVGEQDGHAFIAMQLVEGETLDRRMRRGPMSIAAIVAIARQVAEALAAAHARGIVHRDIKPQNVMVSAGDHVRVLDFGLAKTTSASDESQETVRRLTETGLVAGTVPYMSPEQLRGGPVDARSDIFSFGTMLFEMIARAHPFSSGTSADTSSAILTRDPVAADFPAPPELRRIVRKCLEKDRDRRYQSTRDLVVDLDHFSRDDIARVAAGRPGRRVPWMTITVAATILVATSVFAYSRMAAGRAGTPAAPLTVVQLTDFADSAASPSLSPDGRMVAFIRDSEYFLASGQIYVKTLPNGEPLQLTNDPRQKYGPVFSPDGQRIAFTTFGDGFETWTVPVTGGVPPARLLPNAAGLAWIDDRHVVFSEIQAGSTLHMGVVTATEARADKRAIYLPAHERAMAHYSYPSPDRKWLIVVEMNGKGDFDPCRLLPFDGSSTGQQVGPPGACLLAGWSPDGRTMYFSAEVAGARHLWRQGFPNGAVERIDLGAATEEEGVAIAPDGRSLVTAIGRRQSSLWLHSAGGDVALSPEGETFDQAITSADGARLYFVSRRSTGHPLELQRMEIASRRLERLVPDHEVLDYDISRDERTAAFTTPGAHGPDVWIAAIDRSSAPRLVLTNASNVSFGAEHDLVFIAREGTSNFLDRIGLDGTGRQRVLPTPILDAGIVTPDGRWALEYLGSYEFRAIPVYGGASRTICPDGCRPRWSRDGRWMYVLWSDGTGTNHASAIPLRPGETFPPTSAKANDPLAEWVTLPGVRAIANDEVSPGPDPLTYVFRKVTELKNLFRVPIGGH